MEFIKDENGEVIGLKDYKLNPAKTYLNIGKIFSDCRLIKEVKYNQDGDTTSASILFIDGYYESITIPTAQVDRDIKSKRLSLDFIEQQLPALRKVFAYKSLYRQPEVHARITTYYMSLTNNPS